ncbi:MAG: glycosyltransferase family 2 protein [Burkholderiales bacterium]|nr:glycosyltransferase family 2 protein [Burkholderiales bacterium]
MSKLPLVSILIPAYNAAPWIAHTVASAVAQTWPRKEIIVVDDGSTDGTAEVADRCAPKTVQVVRKPNSGAAASRNFALSLCKGDYIQWLDADDLLSPRKVADQLAVPGALENRRLLLSSSWGYFAYRPARACFHPTALWSDLEPADWLFHKLGKNLHMQTATWLTSRELVDSAGLWDTRLLSDDDGEYFGRVLSNSQRVLFAPTARVYYRSVASHRLSFIGSSDRKMDAMLLSMKLHIQYALALEDTPRMREACLIYVRNWSQYFAPRRQDIMEQLTSMARELGGTFRRPPLRWKYAWMQPIVGRDLAWHAQTLLPHYRSRLACRWDLFMSRRDGSTLVDAAYE